MDDSCKEYRDLKFFYNLILPSTDKKQDIDKKRGTYNVEYPFELNTGLFGNFFKQRQKVI